MAKNSPAWKIEDAREEFLGRCVADPVAFIDALLTAVKRHPTVGADLYRAIIGSGPTRRPVQAESLHDPTQAQLDALAKHLKPMRASTDINHPQPLQVGGRIVLVDAKKGEEIAVLGGTTISYRAIAALIRPGFAEQDLDAIAQAILTQYSGPMTQRSLASRDVRIAPNRRTSHVDQTQDIAEQVVMAIQSSWEKAGTLTRAKNEDPLSYAKRLYAACKGSRDKAAKEALALVQEQIPATKIW